MGCSFSTEQIDGNNQAKQKSSSQITNKTQDIQIPMPSTEAKNQPNRVENVGKSRSTTSAILEPDEGSTQLEANADQFFLSPTVQSSHLSGSAEDGELQSMQKPRTLAPIIQDRALGFVQEQVANHVAHLRNVFAAPLSMFGSGPLPHHPKSPEEIQFMSHHLRSNYLFESLPQDDMVSLIGSFEKVIITEKQIARNPEAAVLIREGELVNQETAYFYLLYRGTCSFTVNNKVVGVAQPGDSFGELALLYDCPRAATVVAVVGTEDALHVNMSGNTEVMVASLTSTTATFTPSSSASSMEPSRDDKIRGVILFRVHQRTFRRVLQQADQSAEETKLNLLNSVAFLKDVSRPQRQKLAAAMKPRPFKKGEYLLRKGEEKCEWTLIERGSVLATNISAPSEDADSSSESKHGCYEDLTLREGNCFGERAISTGTPTMADLIAETDGIAFVVDRETFLEVLGNLQDVILRSLDDAKLLAIQVIINTTQKDERMHAYLASKIEDMSIPEGTVICREGGPLLMDAALYLVRKGKIKISSAADKDEVVGMDNYFGDDQLKADTVGRSRFKSKYTAVALTDCVCGVLKLESFRRIIDTHKMGKAQNINELDSIRIGDVTVTLDQLKLYRILGCGTFGQVWLVSRTTSDGTLRPYALKVQSKHELCTSGQARGVVREKNIMSQFHNPFVAGLVSSFQDGERVYMLMNLIQGGELHSIMHNSRSDVLSEHDARFYLACIAEGLGYMHRHLFVYRDLKPENVLINSKGYAVIIDFGFAKRIVAKTYTMCGTPLYLPPEIILNRGHTWGADHWSLGVVFFEMLVGYTPFYRQGMSKSDLFRAIVQAKLRPPAGVSPEALSLLSGLLRRDPTKRLGSLANGDDDIINHAWFQLDGFDIDKLFLQQLKPPIVPAIEDPLDGSNFSDWSHVDNKLAKQYPSLTSEQAGIFADF